MTAYKVGDRIQAAKRVNSVFAHINAGELGRIVDVYPDVYIVLFDSDYSNWRVLEDELAPAYDWQPPLEADELSDEDILGEYTFCPRCGKKIGIRESCAECSAELLLEPAPTAVDAPAAGGAGEARTDLNAWELEHWPENIRKRAVGEDWQQSYSEFARNDILDMLDVIATLRRQLADGERGTQWDEIEYTTLEDGKLRDTFLAGWYAEPLNSIYRGKPVIVQQNQQFYEFCIIVDGKAVQYGSGATFWRTVAEAQSRQLADEQAARARAEAERDDENRQKRQIHGAYILTTELLAQALGFKSIEGYSTADFIDMVKELKAAASALDSGEAGA